MLHETTITCPRCNVEFPLTETLAAPLIAAERAEIQRETQERATALNKHEQDLSQRRKALEDLKRELDVRQGEIDAAVEQKLRAERAVLAKAAGSPQRHLSSSANPVEDLSPVEQSSGEAPG